jgi:hypothetical protein
VLKLIQQAVADGANLIQQQGDAELDEIAKHAWGKQDDPQECSPSSTELSIMPSLSSTPERTILCCQTHDDDKALKGSTVSLIFVCSSNREIEKGSPK